MAERTPPSGDAFGFNTAPGEGTPDDPLFADLAPVASPQQGQQDGNVPAQGTQQQVTEPAPSQEPASQEPPQEGQPPAEQQQQAPPEEGAQSPEERRYADRYKSVEDLESGYKHIQRLQSRTAAQLQAAELRAQQMEAAIQQLQGQMQARPPGQQPGVETDPVEQLIDQRVAERTQQATQQVQQQLQAQQVAEAIDSFRASHPDVQPGTPLDETMAQIVLEYQRDPETGQVNQELFPVTGQNLNLAYELSKEPQVYEMAQELDLVPTEENLGIAREAVANPALAEVLLAQPSLVDTDHGLAWARKQANLPGVYQQAVQQVTQTGLPDQQRKAAYVETGGTGAPAQGAPGDRPTGDEMDETLNWYKQQREQSIFFGG